MSQVSTLRICKTGPSRYTAVIDGYLYNRFVNRMDVDLILGDIVNFFPHRDFVILGTRLRGIWSAQQFTEALSDSTKLKRAAFLERLAQFVSHETPLPSTTPTLSQVFYVARHRITRKYLCYNVDSGHAWTTDNVISAEREATSEAMANTLGHMVASMRSARKGGIGDETDYDLVPVNVTIHVPD